MHSTLNVFSTTRTIYDGGIVLIDCDFLSGPEHIHRGVLKLKTALLTDQRTAGKNGDVFEHGLAAVSESWSFYSCNLQGSADLVDHKGSECFAVYVFSDDEQRLSGLSYGLEHGKQFLHAADFLVVDQDKWVI